MRVCADQQDGNGEGDSQNHLQVLFHPFDDFFIAGLQEESKLTSFRFIHLLDLLTLKPH